MSKETNSPSTPAIADTVLQVYLLGTVEFEAALQLQRHLVYQISGNPAQAALVFCEHPTMITVGRQGSRSHILYEPEELRARRWRVRWVNRGGGCCLHVPGQLVISPMLSLAHHQLGLRNYLDCLQTVCVALLDDFGVRGETRSETAGIWVKDRMIVEIGVAVRDWVTYYGAILNINPDLELFRRIRNGQPGDGPMTSLERERHGPLRPALVRERFLELFLEKFPFDRTALFHSHPSLSRKANSDALASRP